MKKFSLIAVLLFALFLLNGCSLTLFEKTSNKHISSYNCNNRYSYYPNYPNSYDCNEKDTCNYYISDW